MAYLIDHHAGRFKPASHDLILEAQPDVSIGHTQLFAVVSRKIDDKQSSARRKHARRFGDRGGRRMGIMQHLMDDDAVGRMIGNSSSLSSTAAPYVGVGCTSGSDETVRGGGFCCYQPLGTGQREGRKVE